MSLIQCPDCKKEVSPRATSCPHCGAPMEVEQTLVNCSDCGKEISVRAESCPHCGAPSQESSSSEADVNQESAESGWSVLLRGILIGLFSGGMFYFVFKWINPDWPNGALALLVFAFVMYDVGKDYQKLSDEHSRPTGILKVVVVGIHFALMMAAGAYAFKLLFS